MFHAIFLALLVGLRFASVSQDTVPGATVERETWTMGTRFRVVVGARDRGAAREASEAAVQAVEGVERMLSSWDDSSELGRLNRAPVGQWVAISPELADLLRGAAEGSRRTRGAFDATIGALVDAWDLRGEGRVPDDAALVRALAASGPGRVEVRGGAAVRRVPGAWIDAGGFGKGAALSEAAELLGRMGIERALLDLGGQLWAEAPSGAPWIVGVAHPLRRDEPVAHLAVRGVSVATSGFSERPGHLLDPRTGRPALRWGSVTVVSTNAMEADILATALYVMGPLAGLEWARGRPDVAALFLRLVDGEPVATWTTAMEAWLVDSEQDETTQPIRIDP